MSILLLCPVQSKVQQPLLAHSLRCIEGDMQLGVTWPSAQSNMLNQEYAEQMTLTLFILEAQGLLALYELLRVAGG